jgi:hypothetical protein
MDEIWWMPLVFAGLSLFIAATCVPLIYKLVPPNWLYGVRARKTVSDERIWYPANAYGGKCLAVAGGISFVLECLLALFVVVVPDTIFDGTNLDFWFFTVPMVAFLCVPLLVATVFTLVYVHRLNG